MLVQLRALGECALETEEGRIGPEARYVFALGLYLALERGRKIPRQALVDLLWPDVKNESHARHRFRQTLLRLKQLGVPVVSEKSHLWVERDAVKADFDALLDVNGEAESLVTERDSFAFLQGYQPRFSEEYATWLDLHRSRVELSVQRLFVQALKSARTRGDWCAVEQLALACLRVDPLNEEATMARAEATAMRGSKAQALRILDSYMDALGDSSLKIGLPAKILRARIAERLTQPQYTALSEAHFVGRERDVETLTRMLDEARQGRGAAAVIVGAAGIGKTRLLTEISRVAALKGMQLASASCQPATADRPVGLIADLVTSLRGLPGSIGASVESLSLLQRLTEYSEPTTSAVDVAETGGAGAAIRRAVLDLFDAVSEECPLLVVIEDVHWADSFSWRLLTTIADSAPRRSVLIVASARDGFDAPPREDANAAGSAFGLHALKPLQPGAAQALLERLIDEQASDIPAPMLAWCVDVAEGNPYYLRELLTHWLETREPFGVPRSLSELIDRRLGRLTPEALRVFQACVAFGRSCTIARLEQIEAFSPAQLVSSLEELSRAAVIVSDGVQVTPRHDLLAQAANRTISPAIRALVHRRIAAVLELESKTDPVPASLWECAHHWQLAGEPERAVAFLADCGQHLTSIGLPEEAAVLYRRALEAGVADPQQHFALHDGLIRALRQSGLLEQVHREIMALRDWAALRNYPIPLHSELELLAVEAKWRSDGITGEITRTLSRCLTATDATMAHRLNAGFWLLAVAQSKGDEILARRTWTSLEPLVLNPACDPLPRYQAAMVYHTDYGDLDQAVNFARLFVESARAEGQPVTLLRALRNGALSFRRAGLGVEAKGLLYEAFELAGQHHAALAAADTAHQLAGLALEEEDLETAEEWLAKSSEWLGKCESRFQQADLAILKTRLALLNGSWEDARHIASTLPDWQTDTSVRRSQVVLSIHLALETHEHRPRKELLSAAQSQYHALSTVGHQDFPVECLVNALISCHRRADAAELLAEYVEEKRRDRGRLPRALIRLRAALVRCR